MNATFSGFPCDPPKPPAHLSRTAAIGMAVVALHVGVIWALQSGLLLRAAELVVPVELLAQIIEPPQPEPVSAPPVPAPAVVPAPQVAAVPPKKVVPRQVPKAPTQVQPLAVSDPLPASTSLPAASLKPAPVATPSPVAEAPAAPAVPPAPVALQLPSSNADYLQNPKPPYPPLSKRLGEQGKVIVRVLISVDGTAKNAELRQSSGFERLDQAALSTVLKWRYVPGKRGGAVEEMWFNAPINFVLE